MAIEVKKWLCDAPDQRLQDPSLQQPCKKQYFLQVTRGWTGAFLW